MAKAPTEASSAPAASQDPAALFGEIIIEPEWRAEVAQRPSDDACEPRPRDARTGADARGAADAFCRPPAARRPRRTCSQMSFPCRRCATFRGSTTTRLCRRRARPNFPSRRRTSPRPTTAASRSRPRRPTTATSSRSCSASAMSSREARSSRRGRRAPPAAPTPARPAASRRLFPRPWRRRRPPWSPGPSSRARAGAASRLGLADPPRRRSWISSATTGKRRSMLFRRAPSICPTARGLKPIRGLAPRWTTCVRQRARRRTDPAASL